MLDGKEHRTHSSAGGAGTSSLAGQAAGTLGKNKEESEALLAITEVLGDIESF